MTTTRCPSQYEQNYARLEALMGQPLCDLQSGRSYRLRAPGFMDLVVEVLPQDLETGALVLSLCHYFEQNGDLCQDPEMTVQVFSEGMLEALTFSRRFRRSTAWPTLSPVRSPCG